MTSLSPLDVNILIEKLQNCQTTDTTRIAGGGGVGGGGISTTTTTRAAATLAKVPIWSCHNTVHLPPAGDTTCPSCKLALPMIQGDCRLCPADTWHPACCQNCCHNCVRVALGAPKNVCTHAHLCAAGHPRQNSCCQKAERCQKFTPQFGRLAGGCVLNHTWDHDSTHVMDNSTVHDDLERDRFSPGGRLFPCPVPVNAFLSNPHNAFLQSLSVPPAAYGRETPVIQREGQAYPYTTRTTTYRFRDAMGAQTHGLSVAAHASSVAEVHLHQTPVPSPSYQELLLHRAACPDQPVTMAQYAELHQERPTALFSATQKEPPRPSYYALRQLEMTNMALDPNLAYCVTSRPIDVHWPSQRLRAHNSVLRYLCQTLYQHAHRLPNCPPAICSYFLMQNQHNSTATGATGASGASGAAGGTVPHNLRAAQLIAGGSTASTAKLQAQLLDVLGYLESVQAAFGGSGTAPADTPDLPLVDTAICQRVRCLLGAQYPSLEQQVRRLLGSQHSQTVFDQRVVGGASAAPQPRGQYAMKVADPTSGSYHVAADNDMERYLMRCLETFGLADPASHFYGAGHRHATKQQTYDATTSPNLARFSPSQSTAWGPYLSASGCTDCQSGMAVHLPYTPQPGKMGQEIPLLVIGQLPTLTTATALVGDLNRAFAIASDLWAVMREAPGRVPMAPAPQWQHLIDHFHPSQPALDPDGIECVTDNVASYCMHLRSTTMINHLVEQFVALSQRHGRSPGDGGAANVAGAEDTTASHTHSCCFGTTTTTPAGEGAGTGDEGGLDGGFQDVSAAELLAEETNAYVQNVRAASYTSASAGSDEEWFFNIVSSVLVYNCTDKEGLRLGPGALFWLRLQLMTLEPRYHLLDVNNLRVRMHSLALNSAGTAPTLSRVAPTTLQQHHALTIKVHGHMTRFVSP